MATGGLGSGGGGAGQGNNNNGQPNGLPNGNGIHNKNQIIHIRGDSDSELQALFDSVLKPNNSRMPKQVPLRLRKLPDSFFNPPSVGSKSPSVSVNHSRENSVDSTLNSVRRNPLTPGNANHSRAHSSPATLEQTYSVAQGQPGLSLSQSGSASNVSDDPLPPGWAQDCTPEGQIYFINHITQSTTWEDPRKAQNVQIQAAVGNGPQNQQIILTQQQQQAALAPLPEGWEQAVTPQGETYFIDHRNRKTSWFDPRIPVHLQRPQALQQQITAAAIAQANNQAAAAAAAAAFAAANSSNNNSSNINATNNNPNPTSGGGVGFLTNARVQLTSEQAARIQQLQMEKEHLKRRQQEIMQQMEKEQARLRQQNRLQQMEDGSEIDPFLGGSMVNPSTPSSDFHSRQESADSGLGMGTSYSLPNTPEDFLSNMDDNMDTISESIDAPDIGTLGNDPVESTDDLVPSLHISEELSSELLDEMQSIINSKSDNTMTWL